MNDKYVTDKRSLYTKVWGGGVAVILVLLLVASQCSSRDEPQAAAQDECTTADCQAIKEALEEKKSKGS